MNLYLLQINALKLLINDYEKYIFILLFSFLLSREVLLDIPMKNDSRVDTLVLPIRDGITISKKN